MKKLVILFIFLILFTGCNILYHSPYPELTGSWEYSWHDPDSKKYSYYTYCFNNTDVLEYQVFKNDYYYISSPEYTIFYHKWSVSGNTITMQLCDQDGWLNDYDSPSTKTFSINGDTLILDGIEFYRQ